MFASRAEYRLWRRADNADLRLRPRGVAIGCVGLGRAEMFHVNQQALAEAREVSARLKFSPAALAKRGIAINQDGVPRSALELLAYPDIEWARLVSLWPELGPIRPDIAEQLTIDGRYNRYLARHRQDIAPYRTHETPTLPPDL